MCVKDSIKSEETIHTNDRELPLGMGYKSCWMVVEGATQKAVMDAFLQGKKMKYPYEKGLEKVEKAGAKEGKLLVSATYKKQNYVIGTPVSQFFYETEEFLAKCKDFPRVYVYMTHRVSETHGFALVENGELVRLFKYDESEIANIGQPLPEEIALGYHLPKTFADARDTTGNFTEVNEDMVMALAIRQVGIDVEQYPYKDVRVGKRFEYSSELAKDPYPREDDVVTDEIRNLPLVQRFAAAKTWREKLDIFDGATDELTHPIIDALGESAHVPCYGRLSQRIDELGCALRTAVEYEDRIMTWEELLQEISRGNFVFENRIFKHIVFEGIPCENLTFHECTFADSVFEGVSCENLIFHKCTFRKSRFMEHRIKRLELNDCSIFDSTFSGKWQNTVLILHKNHFIQSKIQDLEVLETSEPSEMTECRFSDCKFSGIRIRSKAVVSGGWFHQCTGDEIEIADMDVGEEPEHDSETNTFQNCSINGEEHK